jgi:hypothetical protein
MWLDRMLLARISFCDRENTIAPIELYYAFDSDLDALFNALRATSVFQAVSDSLQCAVSLTATATRFDEQAPTGINLRGGALTFQTAATTYGTIVVPGLKESVLVSNGCFAGYAVDIANADIQTCAQAIIDANVCTPRQDVFTQLAAGGLRQQWSELDRSSG